MDPRRLIDGLDAHQRAAVTEPTHPLAILAGAGSGKTRVLTRRIAYRCATGDADPRHVLAVTFTRKAANELGARLTRLGLRDLPVTGTFHAIAYAQLRSIWETMGRTPPVLLSSKTKTLSRLLGGARRFSSSDVATEIEWAKSRLISPDRYQAEAARADRRSPVPPAQVAELFKRYEDEKRNRHSIDFDDLLGMAIRAVETDPGVAASLRWRHRHLFVDEFQDVNPLQERLLRAWLGGRNDLCVVGDPNQAIYSWNGADPGYLTNFQNHFPGSKVIELRDSYRCSPQILAVSSAVLGLLGEKRAAPRSHRPDGPIPVVVGYESDEQEANAIARSVREHHRPGKSWSSQAVLVRTNAQTAVIETALRRANIPYRLKGANRFLEDPDVRDLLTRMTDLKEPLATTIEDLTASVAVQRTEVISAYYGLEHDQWASNDLDEAVDHGTALSNLALPDTAVGQRVAAFEQLIRLGHELLAVEPGASSESFPGWVRTVLLDDDPGRGDAVTLASIHAAKGLEWDTVHVAGAEAGYLPITHARSPEARSEEVRLFYVAATRAGRVLRFSWAASRQFGDTTALRKPSPFLDAVRASTGQLASEANQLSAPLSALSLTRAAMASSHDDPKLVAKRRKDAVEVALRRWRSKEARAAGVRPTVVLGERALRSVATVLPESESDLDKVDGLGTVLRARLGPKLLEIVAESSATITN